jgi:hypothetical protein
MALIYSSAKFHGPTPSRANFKANPNAARDADQAIHWQPPMTIVLTPRWRSWCRGKLTRAGDRYTPLSSAAIIAPG